MYLNFHFTCQTHPLCGRSVKLADGLKSHHTYGQHCTVKSFVREEKISLTRRAGAEQRAFLAHRAAAASSWHRFRHLFASVRCTDRRGMAAVTARWL